MRSPGLTSPRMTVCKVSLALLSSLLSVAAGDASFHNPWFLEFGHDNLKHGTEPIPSFKKIPNEDKTFKKPSYALDVEELLLKSGAAYCQEIQPKDTKGASEQKQKQLNCYRCKDPSNGSVYEQCSYSSPLQQRNARSNGLGEKSIDSLSAPSSRSSSSSSANGDSGDNGDSGASEKLPDSFRFSEDYFSPQASEDLPTEYEKNVDNCERIIKDSMVCMLCKDPKSNGKYEQCSYVAQPNEKAYAYTKSSSFGSAAAKPANQAFKQAVSPKETEETEAIESAEEEGSEAKPLHYEHEQPEGSSAEGQEEAHHSHYVPEHSYHYPSYKGYSEQVGEAAEASDASSFEQEEQEDARSTSPSQRVKSKAGCRSVERDGQSCRVCVEPETGAESEKCNYSHEPKDKIYKYTKSKSFGYPDSEKTDESQTNRRQTSRQRSGQPSRQPSRSPTRQPSRQENQDRQRSAEDYGYGSYHSEPSNLDFIRSESEKISKKVKGNGDCREEMRDSMICTVCKDPKTGGDFEQCNYSFEPKDKVFAYSKSKHFGSPTQAASEDEEYSGAGSSEEHTQETYSLPVIYPTGTSPLDYIPKSSESHLSSVYTSQKPQDKPKPDSKVDHGFYDATVRRAEIEKIVKDIGASGTKDRSKCKKMFRGGMSCYHCTDDKGFTNEECVFVNEPEFQPPKQEKKTQAAETGHATTTLEVTINPTLGIVSSTPKLLMEPMVSASWQSLISQRKTRQAREDGNDEEEQQQQQQQQRSKDKDEELEILDEERDEAEPYDYVAETKPVYDKVLGITLPAYMVHKSPQEIEFDQIVENAKF